MGNFTRKPENIDSLYKVTNQLKWICKCVKQIYANHREIDTKQNWVQIETEGCNRICLVFIKDMNPAIPYNKAESRISLRMYWSKMYK